MPREAAVTGATDSRFVRESLLQKRTDGRVACGACERRCRLVEGGQGWCRARVNQGGVLMTLTYGAVSSLSANPIEKKPLFHFYPGTQALTAGGWSCNLGCPWCQNWEITKAAPPFRGEYVAPEDFVELMENSRCQGASISFNEPTLSLEWSLDVFRHTARKGLYNTFITNGYMTPEALQFLTEAGLNAMNVDIKGSSERVARMCKTKQLESVWAICKDAISRGLHLEITTLVIPTVNDDPPALLNIAERIVRDLGKGVPWHVCRYFPSHRFQHPPTPVSTLEAAWRLGRQAGLDFVYIGNVAGHRFENTYCPRCEQLLIRRIGFEVIKNQAGAGCCQRCGFRLPGQWGG